jgi:hypothetical protein
MPPAGHLCTPFMVSSAVEKISLPNHCAMEPGASASTLVQGVSGGRKDWNVKRDDLEPSLTHGKVRARRLEGV